MPRIFNVFLSLLFVGLFAPMAQAIEIEPGEWETTFTMSMPFMPDPQTQIETNCIDESDVNLDSFVDNEENPCEVEAVEDTAAVLSVKLTCAMPGAGTATGYWKVKSEGSTVSGEGKTTMSMGGQEFTTTMQMTSRRTGDCS